MDRENCELDTQYSIAYIRHTLDTRNEFYEAEIQYLQDTMPAISDEEVALSAAIAASPFRPVRAAAIKAYSQFYEENLQSNRVSVLCERSEK